MNQRTTDHKLRLAVWHGSLRWSSALGGWRGYRHAASLGLVANRLRGNAKGVEALSPGLREGRALPWVTGSGINPEWVASGAWLAWSSALWAGLAGGRGSFNPFR